MRKGREASRRVALVLIPVLAIILVVEGCGKSSTSGYHPVISAPSQAQSAVKQESPVAPDNNPPGDIPDSQVFIAYKPPDGVYEVKVPEGWSQSNSGSSTDFTDKLNTVSISSASGAPAPTLERANSVEA